MSISQKSEPAVPVLPHAEADAAACWSCGDMRAAQFCRSCGSVQPPAPTEYFSFFGLPRKLNLDVAALERQMFALSRRLHPDLYARASQQEQEWSLEQTSKLNDAFRTLRDPILRTEYLLRIEGVKNTEQSDGVKKQAVPPELLEEVFEWNMQLEEFRSDKSDAGLHAELSAAKKQLEEKLNDAGAELKRYWDEWDEIVSSQESLAADQRLVLNGMAGLLNRRRYLNNLVREISAELQE